MGRMGFFRRPVLFIIPTCICSILGATLIGGSLGIIITGEKGGGDIGSQIGGLIAIGGCVQFFKTRRDRRTLCQNCRKYFLIAPPGYNPYMGIRRGRVMLYPREGVGGECVKCGRILCHRCYSWSAECRCKSKHFENVKLIYDKSHY
jgi:hypothetical protein